jgi:vitamin-K-epoxide reductase (warfarin-sensitive)
MLYHRKHNMRYAITLLALVGLTVSFLALRVHYSTDTQPCDINEHWDCGIVNHSPFAMIGPVPVAAIGMVGYALLGAFALWRQRALTAVSAGMGLIFALYLSHIEKDVLMVWCLYCVISQVIILALTLLSLGWMWAGRLKRG